MTDKEIEEGNQLMLQFEKRGGLLPVVVQDVHTKQILMLAYVNSEALQKTLETGLATFWSTSRNELWTKGMTSGNTMKISAVLIDCDQDALVYLVEPRGGACHTKNENGEARKSCFYRQISEEGYLAFLE